VWFLFFLSQLYYFIACPALTGASSLRLPRRAEGGTRGRTLQGSVILFSNPPLFLKACSLSNSPRPGGDAPYSTWFQRSRTKVNLIPSMEGPQYLPIKNFPKGVGYGLTNSLFPQSNPATPFSHRQTA
jgi:hypothetical protein